MPTPISRLRDYRDKLTIGTVLGLSYIVDDPAYLTRRSLPIQQLTVHSIQDDVVHFQKQDGHHLHYGLDQPITYLRFGPAPYDQAENILSAPEANDHDDATGPGTALRNDVAAAVSQVLGQHTQAIDKHFAQQQNILAFWVVEGVLDAIRERRASPASEQ